MFLLASYQTTDWGICYSDLLRSEQYFGYYEKLGGAGYFGRVQVSLPLSLPQKSSSAILPTELTVSRNG